MHFFHRPGDPQLSPRCRTATDIESLNRSAAAAPPGHLVQAAGNLFEGSAVRAAPHAWAAVPVIAARRGGKVPCRSRPDRGALRVLPHRRRRPGRGQPVPDPGSRDSQKRAAHRGVHRSGSGARRGRGTVSLADDPPPPPPACAFSPLCSCEVLCVGVARAAPGPLMAVLSCLEPHA